MYSGEKFEQNFSKNSRQPTSKTSNILWNHGLGVYRKTSSVVAVDVCESSVRGCFYCWKCGKGVDGLEDTKKVKSSCACVIEREGEEEEVEKKGKARKIDVRHFFFNTWALKSSPFQSQSSQGNTKQSREQASVYGKKRVELR